MDNAEFMEVGHTRSDVGELKVIDEQGQLRGNSKQAHQSQTVCLWIGSRILHHIPVGHPLGDNSEAT
jgi:hypothetical protein